MTTIKNNKRSYARVIFDRSATLVLHDKLYLKQRIRNLSLIGMFIEGHFEAIVGDLCTIEIHESGKHTSLVLSFAAKVVRVEKEGLGLEFQDMEDDSYMFLQTMILYATQDPLSVAEEFLEDFSPDKSASC